MNGYQEKMLGTGNGGGDSYKPFDSSSAYVASSSSSSSSSFMDQVKARQTTILYGVIAVLSIIVLSLSIALHSAQSSSPSSSPPPANSTAANLRDFVTLDKLMTHANALQSIATANGGTRYIHAPGFNASVAYIRSVLAPTRFNVWEQYFTRPGFEVKGLPPLTLTSPSNDSFTLAYPSDYNSYLFAGSVPCAASCPASYVPAGGCTAASWAAALPNVTAGAVVVVQRSTACTAAVLTRLASAFGAVGVIAHNADPLAGLPVLEAPNPSTIGVLATTYATGKLLELAVSSAPAASPARVTVDLQTSYPSTVVTNVCADTVTGDPTSTIVIGSHSDGVIAGPGIVDNGSGTCGNLVWAQGVDALLRTEGYGVYPNRLRFCWWGAEEQGLLGSKYYVATAANATEVGMRLSDVQLNLNYDMIACPNFVFGVLNGSSGADFPTTIPASVLPGSIALTNLFSSYFESHSLPWDAKQFNGRSDYGSFLTAGIPAGGVSAFIDRLKTIEERDRYNRMLGPGMGGIPNIAIDPCYHQACDSVNNINAFAFEQIGKANGAVLEQLARMQPKDLKKLMFPQLGEEEEKPLYTPKDWSVEDGRYE